MSNEYLINLTIVIIYIIITIMNFVTCQLIVGILIYMRIKYKSRATYTNWMYYYDYNIILCTIIRFRF